MAAYEYRHILATLHLEKKDIFHRHSYLFSSLKLPQPHARITAQCQKTLSPDIFLQQEQTAREVSYGSKVWTTDEAFQAVQERRFL